MKTNRGFSDINQFLGISLTDLANYLNISVPFLSQIGHDKREFSTPPSLRRVPAQQSLSVQVNKTGSPDPEFPLWTPQLSLDLRSGLRTFNKLKGLRHGF